MVEVPIPKEKWSGKVGTVDAGSVRPPREGPATRSRWAELAGMPFLSFEGLGAPTAPRRRGAGRCQRSCTELAVAVVRRDGQRPGRCGPGDGSMSSALT